MRTGSKGSGFRNLTLKTEIRRSEVPASIFASEINVGIFKDELNRIRPQGAFSCRILSFRIIIRMKNGYLLIHFPDNQNKE